MGRTIHYTVMMDSFDQVTAEARQAVHELNQQYTEKFEWTCETPSLETVRWYPLWPDRGSDSKLPSDVKPERAWKIINARYDELEAKGLFHFDIVQKLADEKLVYCEMQGCMVHGSYPKDNYLTRKGLVRARLKSFGYNSGNRIRQRQAPQHSSRKWKVDTPINRCAYEIHSGLSWRNSKSHFYVVLARSDADRIEGHMFDTPVRVKVVDRSFMFRMPSGSTWDETVALVKNRTVVKLADNIHEWDKCTHWHEDDPLMLARGFTKTAGNELNTLTIFSMLLDLSMKLPDVTISVYDEGEFIPAFKCPDVDKYSHHLDLKIKGGRVSLDLADVKPGVRRLAVEHYNLLVDAKCLFCIVDPRKYEDHPQFRTMMLGDSESNEKAAIAPVLHAMEKQVSQGGELAVVDTPPASDPSDDAGALATALTPTPAMWDMLGYGHNFDGPLGDKVGYDLNDKVTFERA